VLSTDDVTVALLFLGAVPLFAGAVAFLWWYAGRHFKE